MEVKTSVFKRGARKKTVTRKDGSTKEYKLVGGWFYRAKYVEPTGRPRVAEHGPFDLKSHANDALKLFVRELDLSQGRSRDTVKMTFADLTDICLAPGGMYEVGSIKSRSSVLAYIGNLNKFFGSFRLNAISRESLRQYHSKRLATTRETKDGRSLTICEATVNRELATMRAMMFFAIGEGWLTSNPFFKLRLIKTTNEIARERILAPEEERRLLAACEGTWSVPYTRTRRGVEETLTATFTIDNRHLRTMMVLALDSGMRRGEILKLQWRDIDFNRGRVHIRPENAKTAVGRIVALSDRAQAELKHLRATIPGDRPFPYSDVKRSFETVKRLAGIRDLRFHDLRRTNISRLQSQGAAIGMVGKAVGHSQLQTTMKHYTVVDDESLERMRNIINTLNSAEPAAARAVADEEVQTFS